MIASRSIEVIDDQMAEVLKAKTPAERLAIAHGMWKYARQVILLNITQENPDWTQQQVSAEAARRLSHGAV